MSWRWGFAAAAVLAIPVVAYGLPRRTAVPTTPVDHTRPREESHNLPLYVLAAAGACAAAVGNILGAFYVESAITRGFDVATAGMASSVTMVKAADGLL